MGFTAEDAEGAERNSSPQGETSYKKMLRTQLSLRSAVWLAPATAAWGFYADSFSCTQANAGLAGYFFRCAVTPDDQGAAGSGVGSSGQAVGSAGTAVGEQSDLGIGQDFDFADDSVAAGVEACASTFGAKRILPEANRVGVFEGLGGGV
jgi:hypothetical protein